MNAYEFADFLHARARAVESGELTEAMQEARDVVEIGVLENFTRAQTPDGQSWPERKFYGDGHPLLIDTAALLEAATQKGGFGHIEDIGPQGLSFGVDGGAIEYAAYLNDGTRRMPAREYMGVSTERIEIIADIVEKHLAAGFE